MKKILWVFNLSIAICSSLTAQSPFTAGNIVVVRVGVGDSLTSSSTAVFLDEYTTGGSFVQSIAMPTSSSGSNAPLTLSGSASSEGSIVGSVDGRYLTIAGYGVGPGTTKVASTTSATVNRVVARIDANASMDITTKLTDASTGNNIRGAVTNDGTAFWVSGAAGSVRYAAPLGATTSIQLSTTLTNFRVVNIFNNQLYVSCAKTDTGILSVGSGMPTTSGQTISLLNGFPNTGSPYGFSINGNTIYVADDRKDGNGGVQKWSYSDSSWSLAYLLAPSDTTGASGLVVDWTGSNPIIYATTTDTNLVTVTDAGSGSPFTTLVPKATKKFLHGVAFAPIPFISFTNGTSYAPPIGIPNTNDNPIGRFKLAGNITGGKLTQVVVTLSGTYSGLTNLKLYYSTAASFSVGSSTLLSTVASPSSQVTFDISSTPQPIATSGGYFYVAADLSSGAAGSAMASLDNQTKLTFTNASLNGTFSGANLSSGNVTLPVEMTTFTAVTTGSTAMLKWSTATEINNYGFEVERRVVSSQNPSNSSSDWEKIAWSCVGFVEGNGTSSSPHNYVFSDNTISSGTYAYRLKQVNNDGSFKYLQEAQVTIETPKVFALNQNFPNPFNPTTVISYQLPVTGYVSLKVYDMLGRKVATLVNEQKTAGSYLVTFDAHLLPSGVYFYNLQVERFKETKEMVLIK